MIVQKRRDAVIIGPSGMQRASTALHHLRLVRLLTHARRIVKVLLERVRIGEQLLRHASLPSRLLHQRWMPQQRPVRHRQLELHRRRRSHVQRPPSLFLAVQDPIAQLHVPPLQQRHRVRRARRQLHAPLHERSRRDARAHLDRDVRALRRLREQLVRASSRARQPLDRERYRSRLARARVVVVRALIAVVARALARFAFRLPGRIRVVVLTRARARAQRGEHRARVSDDGVAVRAAGARDRRRATRCAASRGLITTIGASGRARRD